MRLGGRRGERGIALTIVILIITLVSLVSSAALTIGFHQRTLAKKAVSSRTQSYYFAQAGLIDAMEILRKDAAGQFANPNFNPAPYTIDIDADGTNDVTVDIGAQDPATGRRTVRATGRSTAA